MGNSLRAVLAIILVGVVYRFVLTDGQRSTLNATLSSVSKTAVTQSTVQPLPTAIVPIAKLSVARPGSPKPVSTGPVAVTMVPTAIPLCSQTARQDACIPDPTPLPIPTQEPVVVAEPVFVAAPAQIDATATVETQFATAAPEFTKPDAAGTCQFIGCLPGRTLANAANYQRECHAMYWQYEGEVPTTEPDRSSVSNCIATGDYR